MGGILYITDKMPIGGFDTGREQGHGCKHVA
jgi:hypothetical protein